jgi:hypothetical protein
MPGKVKIVGSHGENNELRLFEDGALKVYVDPAPTLPKDGIQIPYRQYLTDDGLTSGSNDARVNGSSASPIDFYVEAIADYDIYISKVSFEISDASATLNKFGNITALTNGCELCWQSQDLGTIVLGDELKSNWDFIRLCGGNPAIGDGAAVFRANNVSGNSEGYIPFLDIADTFKMAHGLVLRKNTKDRFFLRVNDDTRAVDSFNMIVYGKRL